MGLNILINKLQELRKNPQVAQSAGLSLSIADAVCLDEFLKLIAVNTTALIQFKALITSIRGITSQSLSAAQLIIAQMQVTVTILNTFVNTFKSAKTQAVSSVSPFPFKNLQFQACSPVQKIKTLIATQISRPDPTSVLPGAAGSYAKKFKMTVASLRDYEYRIFKINKRIQQINTNIAEMQALLIVLDGILEAIEEQFGV